MEEYDGRLQAVQVERDENARRTVRCCCCPETWCDAHHRSAYSEFGSLAAKIIGVYALDRVGFDGCNTYTKIDHELCKLFPIN